MALEDDEVESVGERELRDALFEILEGLGGERERAEEQGENSQIGRFHAGLALEIGLAFTIVAGGSV